MKAYICNPDKTLEVPGENSKMILEFDPAPRERSDLEGKRGSRGAMPNL
jgi:hypothetical protein